MLNTNIVNTALGRVQANRLPSGITFLSDYSRGAIDAKRSNGSPTATFTASRGASNPATYVDSDGIVQVTTTSDAPRYQGGYYDATGFHSASGLLLEGASTNELKNTTFSAGTTTATNFAISGSYTGSYTTSLVSESLTSISGSQAQRLQYTGTGTDASKTLIFRQDITPAGASPGEIFTGSIYLKGTFVGGGDVKLGVASWGAGWTNNTQDTNTITLSTEWQRVNVTHTVGAGAGDILRLFVDFQGIDENDTVDVQFACAQLEKQAYPSSFIPTTTSVLTRNAESLSYPVADNFVGGTDGTILMKYRPVMLPDEQPGGYAAVFQVLVGSGNNWTMLYATNVQDFLFFKVDSDGGNSNTWDTTTGWERYVTQNITGTFSTNETLKQYDNGVLVDEGSEYNVPVGSLPTSFLIQSSAGQAMILESIALWNRRLSASEVAKVQTILG